MANMMITARSIIQVAIHPSHYNRREITNRPINRGLLDMSIIPTIIGTEITPLITALQ
jgi:hypothetical protein